MIRRPPRSTLFPYTRSSDLARLWLANGWVDYLAPQLYCPINAPQQSFPDRKRTRLNSSHVAISYAVFCFEKKKACLVHNSSLLQRRAGVGAVTQCVELRPRA